MWRSILVAVLIALTIYVGYQVSRAQQTARSDQQIAHGDEAQNPHGDGEKEVCLGADSYTYEIDGKRYSLPFEVIGDQAVVEGDIVFGRATDIQKAGANYVAPVVPDYVRGEQKLWEGNIVPYVVDASVTASDRSLIQQAITAWQRTTNVRFKQLSGARDWQTENYVKFSGKNAQCTSNSLGIKERLSGRVNEDDNINVVEVAGCGQNWGRVAHEIGHILGLGHEHSRGDRDYYITILWSNIDGPKQFCRALWDTRALANTTYNYDSIMHYAPDQAVKRSTDCRKVIYDGKEQCLAFLPNQEKLEQQRRTLGSNIRPGQRDHLSEGDIARVNALYQASSPNAPLANTQPCVRTTTTSIKIGDQTTTTTKTEPCSSRSQRTIVGPSPIRPLCCRDREARYPFPFCRSCQTIRVRWPRPDGWCRPGWCRAWPRNSCDGWLDARWERPRYDDWDGE